MEFRTLGASGLNVPLIGLGTANFRNEANPVSGIGDKLAARLIDTALDHGAGFFDTGNGNPGAEVILGKALGKRRSQVLIAAKAGMRTGFGPNETGATRHNLIAACEASLQRLGTDYIDLLQIQGFDARTSVDETLSALDGLICAGKVRTIGCSNYAGWQLMKSLAASDRLGVPRFAAQQVAYSLAARDCEHELLPLGADQHVAALAWGPLAGGLLAGSYGRDGQSPGYLHYKSAALDALSDKQLNAIIDCLGEVSRETGASPAQVALRWLMQRPSVATIFVGASSTAQLEASLDAINVRMTGDQSVRLNDISLRPAPYPHAWQRSLAAERSIALVPAQNVRVDKTFPFG